MTVHSLRRTFARQGLRVQLVVLMSVMLAVLLVASAAVRHVTLQSQALERARLVAAMAEAAGAWASERRGVWVFSDPADGDTPVGDALDHRQARVSGADPADASSAGAGSIDIARVAGTFHRKTPSMMQRELGEALLRLGRTEAVRITTDRPFDPGNTVTPFERAAIAKMRAEPPVHGAPVPAEYHETGGGRLWYARALIATADCVRCHGMPTAAPAAMRARFGGSPAWGLQPGDFAGIVSVSVPLDVGDTAAGLGAAAWTMGTLALVWLGCLLLVLGWLQHRVIGAAGAMEDYVRHLLSPKTAVHPSPIMVDSEEVASDNEMHRLSLALKAVHRALRMARGERPP